MGGGLICGIKIPQQEFALKMQGGGGGWGGIAEHYGNYKLQLWKCVKYRRTCETMFP